MVDRDRHPGYLATLRGEAGRWPQLYAWTATVLIVFLVVVALTTLVPH
jgi:hypothetical protein